MHFGASSILQNVAVAQPSLQESLTNARPRSSSRPFYQAICLLLCYSFVVPFCTINLFPVVAASTDKQSTANRKSSGFLPMMQSGGSAPTPGVPGPHLPNLDEVRQIQPLTPEPPPAIPSICNECPPPDPTPTPANHPPSAIISSPPSSGQVGQSLTFNGSASFDIDPGDSITNYAWNFGDGSQAVSGGSVVSHTYSSASATAYTVSLTVTDAHNATNTRTTAVSISAPPSPAVNAAEFVTQSQIPTSMTTGQQLAVWVKMKNTGTGAWQNDSLHPHKLGSQNPQDNSNWGLNRVALPSTISSGQEATFSFTMTAPSTPGTYLFQ
jgi:hypothetical protein